MVYDPRCPDSPAPGVRDKAWRGLCVDSELHDDWLGRLNSIEEIEINGMCAGHKDPHFDVYEQTGQKFPAPPSGPSFGWKERRPFEAVQKDARSAFDGWASEVWDGMPKDLEAEINRRYPAVFTITDYPYFGVATVSVYSTKLRSQLSDREWANWWEEGIRRVERAYR